LILSYNALPSKEQASSKKEDLQKNQQNKKGPYGVSKKIDEATPTEIKAIKKDEPPLVPPNT